MTTAHDCALNGVRLSSLNDRICVLDIREDAPKLRTTCLSLHPEGHHVLRQTRESLTLRVIFALHEEDPIRRREALNTIHAWTFKGGMLTTSDRPAQQMQVTCTSLAPLSAEDWTEELTLAFQSARTPYWEDAQPTSVTGSDALVLDTPGTADAAPVDVMIVNDTEETVTRVTLIADETQMVFEGLSFHPGSRFSLNQSDGPLLAEIDGESVLHCRTPNSSDCLLVPCGRRSTVSAAATLPLTSTFTVRGRYA